jgi:Ca-activated chloride channel family protein
VTFAWPLALVGLAAIPVLAVLYLLSLRRRRRDADRFANPALVPNLIGARPGWRRHFPVVLMLIALTALGLGLARPHAAISVPREEATIVLAVDTSRSMVATDVKPTRLAAAQKAIRAFIAKVPDKYRVGMVSFGDVAYVVAPATTNREVTEAALRALRPGEGTALGDGIARSIQLARGARSKDGERPPAAILVLSDGAQTQGVLQPLQAAQRAQRFRIPVYTVALGTEAGVVEVPRPDGLTERVTVPPDPATLREIASVTRGRFYAAPDGASLEAVYKELGSRIGRTKEDRELTAAFAGAGALLLLGALGFSALVFGRVP